MKGVCSIQNKRGSGEKEGKRKNEIDLIRRKGQEEESRRGKT
jgi:hypothetical protein